MSYEGLLLRSDPTNHRIYTTYSSLITGITATCVAARRCPSLPVAAFSFLLPPFSRSDACFSVSASWRYRCRKHDFLFALIYLYFVYLPNVLFQRACLGPWNLFFCYFGLLKGIDLRILG